MNKKLQVFVSSTYLDMRAERQAAVDAILGAGHIPAGMELFTAGDEIQLATIRRWIDDSDVFLLILGGRYGSIEPKSDKSYIHLEYEYAKKQGKPYFAAVMSEKCLDAKVDEDGKRVLELTNPRELAEFRKQVMSNICESFDTTDRLQLIVQRKLNELARRTDLVGWVRADQAGDQQAMIAAQGRVIELQEENAKLKEQVAAAGREPEFAGVAIQSSVGSTRIGIGRPIQPRDECTPHDEAEHPRPRHYDRLGHPHPWVAARVPGGRRPQ